MSEESVFAAIEACACLSGLMLRKWRVIPEVACNTLSGVMDAYWRMLVEALMTA